MFGYILWNFLLRLLRDSSIRIFCSSSMFFWFITQAFSHSLFHCCFSDLSSLPCYFLLLLVLLCSSLLVACIFSISFVPINRFSLERICLWAILRSRDKRYCLYVRCMSFFFTFCCFFLPESSSSAIRFELYRSAWLVCVSLVKNDWRQIKEV